MLPSEVISNTSLVYYRLHGMEQLYASNYEEHQLLALIEKIRKDISTTDAYIFFNNDINTFAVHNGLLMSRLVGVETSEKNPI